MSEAIASIGAGRLGRVVVARLAPGADLLKSLLEIAERERIKSGVILSCAASLSQAALRNVRQLPPELPVTDRDRVFLKKEGPIELLTLTGNIAEQDGQIAIHAHLTISMGDEDGRSYGGHLIEGCKVFSLAELAIAEIEGIRLVRTYDAPTRGPQLNVVV